MVTLAYCRVLTAFRSSPPRLFFSIRTVIPLDYGMLTVPPLSISLLTDGAQDALAYIHACTLGTCKCKYMHV
jgi:hypothetical protein